MTCEVRRVWHQDGIVGEGGVCVGRAGDDVQTRHELTIVAQSLIK